MEFESSIKGHLDIFAAKHEVLIHGDPEGLRSLAALLLKMADLDQDTDTSLPVGAREHVHLRPNFELSGSSATVIVGRLDAKGTGAFYDRYAQKVAKE